MNSKPFTIAIPQTVLDDMQRRVAATRLPDWIPTIGWQQGIDTDVLRQLLQHWNGGFDWRAEEAHLNTFNNQRVMLDNLEVHFVHERAADGRGFPLLLTHGWPSSFVELLRLAQAVQ